MGYDLHITRRDYWSDDAQQSVDITLEEWFIYLKSDPELELSDAYRIKVPGRPNESQVAPGFCEWNNHPANERPWFDFSNGSISTKNPDDATIKKMLSISKQLDARVQGDNGEFYRLSSDNTIISGEFLNHQNISKHSERESGKSWWKFW